MHRDPLRQGDILLIPVREIPGHAERRALTGNSVVVAEGEATGHTHTLIDDIIDYATTADHVEHYVRVGPGPTLFTHQEHDRVFGPIPVAEGAWEARRQREYAPEAARYVAD